MAAAKPGIDAWMNSMGAETLRQLQEALGEIENGNLFSMNTFSPMPRLQQLADAARLIMQAEVAVVYQVLSSGQTRIVAISADPSVSVAHRWPSHDLPLERQMERQPRLVDLTGDAVSPLTQTRASLLRESGVQWLLSYPLRIDDNIVGILEIGWCTAPPPAYSSEHTILQPLAVTIARTLHVESPESVHLAARQQRPTNSSPSQSSVLAAGLQRLGAELRELLQADIGLVYVPSGTSGQLKGSVVAGSRPGAEVLGALPLNLEAPLVQDWIKAPASLLDLVALIRAFGRHAMMLQLQSGIVAPIWGDSNILLGFVLLLRSVPQAFSEADRAHVERVLNAMVPLLALGWQLEQADRARALREALLRLATALVQATSLGDVGRLIGEALRADLDVVTGLLGIVSNEQVVWYGTVGERLLGPVASQLNGESASEAVQNQRILHGAGRFFRLPAELTALGLSMVPETLLVPAVQAAQRVVLLVQRPGMPFSPDEEWFLQGAAQWAAQVAQSLRALDAMQRAGDARASLLAQLLAYQEEERKRLVDAIHNQTLQGLATCLYRIELIIRQAEEQLLGDAASQLRQVRDMLAEHITLLREAVFQLRPVTLDHLGLEAALREYLAKLSDRGITGTLDLQLNERLNSELETAIYRVVQEAIERVRQPAGIRRVIVRVREGLGEKVIVTIADDAPRAPQGQGSEQSLPLVALRERVTLLGGVMQVASVAQAGTVIQLVLPKRRTTRFGSPAAFEERFPPLPE
jgi:signal transduction histidine kinase